MSKMLIPISDKMPPRISGRVDAPTVNSSNLDLSFKNNKK